MKTKCYPTKCVKGYTCPQHTKTKKNSLECVIGLGELCLVSVEALLMPTGEVLCNGLVLVSDAKKIAPFIKIKEVIADL